MQAAYEVQTFCKWIRRAVASSSIERLRIICDEEDSSSTLGANVAFNSLIDHLAKKHSTTLRLLDIGSAYVGVDALKSLFETCLQLEEFRICAGKDALVALFLLNFVFLD